MGWSDPYYVKGQNATFDGQNWAYGKGYGNNKTCYGFCAYPDYRVEGQDIKVYPGDKVVIKTILLY